MRDNAPVIVAGIGVLVAGAAAVALMAVKHEGWAFLCAGLCIGFAAVFAIEYSDLRATAAVQKRVRRSWTKPTPDFPPQPKRPIR